MCLLRAVPVVFLLSACASAGSRSSSMPGRSRVEIMSSQGNRSATLEQTPETRSFDRILNSSQERIWELLPEIFEATGVEAGIVSQPDHVFGNPNLRIRGRLAGERTSRYLDCGVNAAGGPRAGTDLVQASVLTYLEALGEESARITIQIGGLATEAAGNTRASCVSTGQLEERLLQELEDRLGPRES